jgi:hypothetical protein
MCLCVCVRERERERETDSGTVYVPKPYTVQPLNPKP